MKVIFPYCEANFELSTYDDLLTESVLRNLKTLFSHGESILHVRLARIIGKCREVDFLLFCSGRKGLPWFSTLQCFLLSPLHVLFHFEFSLETSEQRSWIFLFILFFSSSELWKAYGVFFHIWFCNDGPATGRWCILPLLIFKRIFLSYCR